VFLTVKVDFAEVGRYGILRLAASGSIARRKVAGDVAEHLCFRDRRGKTRAFMVSLYEGKAEIIGKVSRILKMEPEPVGMHLRWQKRAA
jgi:hypothetical protein